MKEAAHLGQCDPANLLACPQREKPPVPSHAEIMVPPLHHHASEVLHGTPGAEVEGFRLESLAGLAPPRVPGHALPVLEDAGAAPLQPLELEGRDEVQPSHETGLEQGSDHASESVPKAHGNSG